MTDLAGNQLHETDDESDEQWQRRRVPVSADASLSIMEKGAAVTKKLPSNE